MKNLLKKNVTVGGICKMYAVALIVSLLFTGGVWIYIMRPFDGLFFKKKKKYATK